MSSFARGTMLWPGDALPAFVDLSGMTVPERLARLGIDPAGVHKALAAVPKLTRAAEAAKKAMQKAQLAELRAAALGASAAEQLRLGAVVRVAETKALEAATKAREAQATVRAFGDRLVQAHACVVHDSMALRDAWEYRVESLARRHLNGYHTFTGRIGIDTRRHAQSVEALASLARGEPPGAQGTATQWDTVRTLVHETVHGHSPLAPPGYRNHGAAIEEATTELSARYIMDRVFGTHGGGSYDGVIARLETGLLAHEVATGGGAAAAAVREHMALAALRFHGPTPVGAGVSLTPDEHLRLYARWYVQTRHALPEVPASNDPRVRAVYNALLPRLIGGP
jgi:hypothetical protein